MSGMKSYDELAVGDRPFSDHVDDELMCPATNWRFGCTRPAGHDGQHVAEGTTQVWAVWRDDDA